MESPTLAAMSVCAHLSDSSRAELDAFVAWNRARRPGSWRRVEQLQRICREHSPASAAGLEQSVRWLRRSALAEGCEQGGASWGRNH
jgi:hypothetical protein